MNATDVAGDGVPLPTRPMRDWAGLIETIGPASLLVVIESRMGAGLRRNSAPDDILQEALLRAWKARDTLEWRGEKAFRSWLLTLIDHVLADSADYLAARKRGGPGIGAPSDSAPALALESAGAEPAVS